MDGRQSAMEAAGRGRLVVEGTQFHVRRTAPCAASDANGHRKHGKHGRGGTAAGRLIIRGRLGLDEVSHEGRGEARRGRALWPELWAGLR